MISMDHNPNNSPIGGIISTPLLQSKRKGSYAAQDYVVGRTPRWAPQNSCPNPVPEPDLHNSLPLDVDRSMKNVIPIIR